MRLEIDAGNSRIKWRQLDEADAPVSGGAMEAYGEPDAVVADLVERLASPGMQRPEVIRVASVRGAGFREVFNDSMLAHFEVMPVYAQVRARCAGLENSYADPGLMGVDRWLAMVAAWLDCRRGLCVVDAGSALTVDLVSAEGRHLGGYILPGLHMMLSALSARSDALSFRHRPAWSGVAPGTDTHSAMEHGVLSLSLGLLERIRRLHPGLGWYLTGGDAQVLGRHLDWNHEHRPELVLDGLIPVLRAG